MLPWLAGLLWLKSKTDFPDSFGHHNALHGKAGVFDEYLHSNLLLHRPGFWEITLFVWMWAPVAGCGLWILGAVLKDRIAKRVRLFDDPGDT